jgi:hypothetical protein
VIDLSEGLKKRAKELLQTELHIAGGEAAQFATTMLTSLYGPQSPQLAQFRDGCEAIAKNAANPGNNDFYLRGYAVGAIRNATAELDAGLIVNVRAAVTGEVLSELLHLAREILHDQTDAAKNVGSVLVAAAYEDLIRRMGEEFAGVTGRPDLQGVIIALKNQNVLKGGEVGTAQSYLKFRNDSLHADWNNVSRSLVESCLAFVEGLLLKHFGA